MIIFGGLFTLRLKISLKAASKASNSAAIFKLAAKSLRSDGCRDSRAAPAGRRLAHAGRQARLRLGLHFEARCLQHSLRLKISLKAASKASNSTAIFKLAVESLRSDDCCYRG
jgi:hypothetical protein